MADPVISEDQKEKAAAFSILEKGKQFRDEVQAELNEKEKDTTDTGRKSKAAKNAENAKIIAGGLEAVLTGINTMIAPKLPEFEHSEEELKTIALLSAPVAVKYFDLDMLEYKDEYKLITYLVACEMQKVKSLINRLRAEAEKEQNKSEDKNKKDKSKPPKDAEKI